MTPIGYSYLIDMLEPNGLPLARLAFAHSSVDRRVISDARIPFPIGVAVENSLVGHLECLYTADHCQGRARMAGETGERNCTRRL